MQCTNDDKYSVSIFHLYDSNKKVPIVREGSYTALM